MIPIVSYNYGNGRCERMLLVVVSLLRGMVFIALGIYWFSRWFGLEGIWYVIPTVRFCTLLVHPVLSVKAGKS